MLRPNEVCANLHRRFASNGLFSFMIEEHSVTIEWIWCLFVGVNLLSTRQRLSVDGVSNDACE